MPSPLMRIAGWYGSNLPELLDDLAPGCSEVDLRDFEALIGAELPEDFRQLYQYHNGQLSEYRCGIFYGMEFQSLESAGQYWLLWKDVINGGLEVRGQDWSAKPGAVKEVYASLGWIPFALDRGGNHLGIDLDPGPTGTRGQVINFGGDESEKFVLAPSLNAFLEWMADQLDSGNILIHKDSAAGPYLSTRNPPTDHLLDSVKVMFAWQRSSRTQI